MVQTEPAPVTMAELLKVPLPPPMFAVPGWNTAPPFEMVNWFSGPRPPIEKAAPVPVRRLELVPVTVTRLLLAVASEPIVSESVCTVPPLLTSN